MVRRRPLERETPPLLLLTSFPNPARAPPSLLAAVGDLGQPRAPFRFFSNERIPGPPTVPSGGSRAVSVAAQHRVGVQTSGIPGPLVTDHEPDPRAPSQMGWTSAPRQLPHHQLGGPPLARLLHHVPYLPPPLHHRTRREGLDTTRLEERETTRGGRGQCGEMLLLTRACRVATAGVGEDFGE